MAIRLQRPLSLALGAIATTLLAGCYDGGVRGAGYASSAYACETRYGAGYYSSYDPYAYDDGYGYDCYDGADYGGGFVQIGFGGGWYDDYYYPGHGMWMYGRDHRQHRLSGHYLNYWGGRRAWWMHRQDRQDRPGNWNRPGGGTVTPPASGNRPGAVRPRPSAPGDTTSTRPGRGDQTGRPGGWNRGERDGTRPERRPGNTAVTTPPATGNPSGAGAMRPRQPATERSGAPPGWGDAAQRGGTTRPAVERPARMPDRARPSAPPRAAPAPTARPESGSADRPRPQIRRSQEP